MYEITAYLNRKEDLEAFLDKTRQFGKKFYQCHRGGNFIKSDGSEFPIMQVLAIAISRDLTYKLHCIFPYDRHIDYEEYCKRENELEAEEATGKFPIMNAIPHEDMDRELFYPYLKLEGSSRPYENVFAHHRFTRVHKIAKDGDTLL